MNKLIIDTDPGHDDALALMLLFKSKRFDIKAITTVAGNSTINKVTRNAQAILDLLGENKVPVFSGKSQPLKRDLVMAVVHGDSGLDGFELSNTKYQLTSNADEKIIELIDQTPGEITLLTLGPLTNIARAFIKKPKIVKLIKQIVIMGGVINVRGNKNRVAEFNMFVDPEAADIVFKSKVKKILIPLDICNEIVIPLADFENLKGTSLYKPIKVMMKEFAVGIEKDLGVKGVLLYDAVAAYYLVNPEVFKLKSMDILIETKGEYTFGMTVAEKRKKARKNFNIQVATRLNKKVFIKDLFAILKR